jgi:hypothetical protein
MVQLLRATPDKAPTSEYAQRGEFTMGTGVNSTKDPARPSHEALVHREGDTQNLNKKDQQAMESARRGQQRMKQNEGKIPGSKIFTK